MLLVAVYKGDSMQDMKMLTGTFDPNVVSQVTTIIKKALDDGFDRDLDSKNSEASKQ